MLPLALFVLVQGTLELQTSPPPGEVFQGDGHAVVLIAADDVHIVDAVFDGVSVKSPAETKGTIIAGSTFRNSRMSEQGSCYYGGGQPIMVANAVGNPPKLVVGNRIEDYDCIGISVYNHGPVHNINLVGNSDDGSGLWSLLGPREDFRGLVIVGNTFTAPFRLGHGAFMPKGSGLVLSDNTFHSVVSFMISDSGDAITECGNRYESYVWRSDVRPTRLRNRSRCEAPDRRESDF